MIENKILYTEFIKKILNVDVVKLNIIYSKINKEELKLCIKKEFGLCSYCNLKKKLKLILLNSNNVAFKIEQLNKRYKLTYYQIPVEN